MSFKRLYKFYSEKSAMRNLEQRRLKISRLQDINDPFEWNPYRLDKAEDRKTWEKLREQLWRDKGLISFSDRWSNPVLWSHYAESHKGLCLGFDISDKIAFPVLYKNIRQKLPSLQQIANERDWESLKDASLIKYSHWRYETEWRILTGISSKEEEGLYFEPFSGKLKLKEVIIGAHSSAKSEEIRKLVGEDVEISTARLAFKTFKVTKQWDKGLQK
ncbi:DUF2971 domain-containing protein [Puniceibacterium sediminis]|uniref:DUF2971 domain-containing protein n=1 Tax=Puniceibacterium sediminis TaxID=1608407 RepID=A0A238YT22_9RHOB|nr:DUF2971 domain-containing protein [Puniceibacterium sediminis]SNR73841.1 Protein of unknown function [Puniceibacterium sediminis]